jgi:hypothetical protein
VQDKENETIFVTCPHCGFELTLLVKPQVAERLMQLGVNGVVCWQCRKVAMLVRSGGEA